MFIDADSLIYGNLNVFFDYHVTGVRHFGYQLSLDDPRGWFTVDSLTQKWASRIRYKILSHGGIFYFCDDSLTRAVYDTSLQINEEYDTMKFTMFDKPADEPIMALAMCVHDCAPIEKSYKELQLFCFAPNCRAIEMDIRKGKLRYSSIFDKEDNWIEDCKILHWSNIRTTYPDYKREVDRMKYPAPIVFLRYVYNEICMCCRNISYFKSTILRIKNKLCK